MSIEVIKYLFAEKEVHMTGQYVGVCWNLSQINKEVEADNTVYSAKVKVRSGKPYISFLSIREAGKGEYYEDNDSPIDGGIELQTAIVVKQELEAAIDYMNSL
jgi:hypothetical protein